MTQYTEMSLPVQLQKALGKLNFSEPTKIQAAVIPIATEGRDLIACAETGSGKTAAYGIPMISRLLEFPESNALILAPTRELVHQIADFFRELTTYTPGMNVTSIVGGADMRKQLNALKRQPRVIVATPGRLIDHLKRRSIQLQSTNVLVLDEGDRMIDMGFAPQLEEILKYLPKERQTSLFTATMTDKVRKLAQKYLQKPENITVGAASQPVSAIKQSVVQVTGKQKNERIIDELNARQGSVIVFAKTKRRTDILAKHLEGYGFSVDLIHGDRSQGQRNRAIQNFRQGKCRILCATDIASRGIDIPQVELVINFDLPMMDEDYVHRIGRTARNGASGEALSFVTPEESRTWQVLVRKYRIQGADLVRWAPQDRGGNGSGEGRGAGAAGRGGEARRGRGGKPAARSHRGSDETREFRGGRKSDETREFRGGRKSDETREFRGGRKSDETREFRGGRKSEETEGRRGRFGKRDGRRSEEGFEFRGRKSEETHEFRGGRKSDETREFRGGRRSEESEGRNGRSFAKRDDRRSEDTGEFRGERKARAGKSFAKKTSGTKTSARKSEGRTFGKTVKNAFAKFSRNTSSRSNEYSAR